MAPVSVETEGRGAVTSAAIRVDKLTKRFRSPGAAEDFVVLDTVSISVDEGKFVSIVGPSGCGKSTLLNVVAGIETYDGGLVTLAQKTAAPPRIGYVLPRP